MPYVIEGTWSGYRSEQRRVVHRHYVKSEKEADAIRKIGYSIGFSDGTELILSVKQVARRTEPEILGYRRLIADCRYFGVSSVDALVKAQKLAQENANRIAAEMRV